MPHDNTKPQPFRFKKELGLFQMYHLMNKYRNEPQTVAVIDSGFPTEAELAESPTELQVEEVKKFYDSDFKSNHGTLTATTARAVRENGIGVDGMSEGKTVLIDVLPSGHDGGDDATLAQGLNYALDEYDPSVIIMSLDWPENDKVRKALTRAASEDALLVAAAGNDGEAFGSRPLPARHPEVMAVGATDTYGSMADYTTWPADICAWGWRTPSLTLDKLNGTEDTPYWWEPAVHAGTSGATAIVGGIAAAGRRLRPDLSRIEMQNYLVTTGVPLDTDHYIGPRVHGGNLSYELLSGENGPLGHEHK